MNLLVNTLGYVYSYTNKKYPSSLFGIWRGDYTMWLYKIKGDWTHYDLE